MDPSGQWRVPASRRTGIWHEPDAVIASHEAELRAIGARRLMSVYRLARAPVTTRGYALRAAAGARGRSIWAIIRGMGDAGHRTAVPTVPAVPMPPAYRTVVTVGGAIMRWCRLRVSGLDALPSDGPTLVIANHDSYWDPIAIAVAARSRRQIRALAKSTLWKVGAIGRLMDSMGHIPIERGATNETAMSTATEALGAGACIGVFPEGTRSLGTVLRARSGAGRLALAVPEAVIVCARVTGTTDVVRLPKRPNVTVDFFRPAQPRRPDEDASALMQRLLDEIRSAAPPSIPGRARTSAKFARRAAAAPSPKAGTR